MKIAALYDLHGNLPALEAVLAEIRGSDVDAIVVGGDVVPGPLGSESLERLRDLDLPVQWLRGNGELAVSDQRLGRDPGRALPPAAVEMVEFSAADLTEEQIDLVASWPKSVVLEIDGQGAVLFCHATPRDENEIFTRLTPDSAIVRAFSGVEAPVVVCGHTHMSFDRRVGSWRILNAGSVGMPFGDSGAHWLVLGPEIEFRRTEYDPELTLRAAAAKSYPQLEELEKSLMDPPSEEQMLEIFSQAEIS